MRPIRWLALITTGLLLSDSGSLRAHPSVSIVRDSAGNIYYSDIARVWRLTPDGSHTVYIPAVHTHELHLDGQDRLHGEHLWYDSSRAEPWQHYLWRASRKGAPEKIHADRSGFRRDHGFARDRAGRHYWADRTDSQATAIRCRTTDGAVSTLVTSSALTDVRWLTCSPEGMVYFIHRDDLFRLTADGRLRIMARNLAETQAADRSHLVQGLSADDAGVVHAAVSGLGVIKRIDPDGQVTIVDRSPAPWRPSGVLASAHGELWVLEYDPDNRMRLRHRDATGRERIHGPGSTSSP